MSTQQDILWKDVWTGLAIAVGGSIVLGGILFAILDANMWLFVIASDIAIGVAGFRLGRKTGRWEGISATLIALFYYVAAALILLAGMMWEFIPDPLPGLPRGDSTFYFVWPLTLLACPVIGMAIGTKAAAGKASGAKQVPAGGSVR